MRILLHSKTFYPSVGGVERVTHTLASYLSTQRIIVQVVTDTPFSGATEPGEYPVVRRPSSSQKARLVCESDLVHVNGFSLDLLPYALFFGKPLIWQHQGYQASCIAGIAWHAGQHCHYQSVRCFRLVCNQNGLRSALRGLASLLLHRLGLVFAAKNVCITRWLARRIKAPRSVVIWNPVDIATYHTTGAQVRPGRFTFLGRLVQEKGCDVLIRALAACHERGKRYGLDVYGDGPERANLGSLVEHYGLSESVTFHGLVEGESLRQALTQSWVVVVPSSWEEALGIVAVEAMAAGKPLIVSRAGGLAEVSQGCSLTFRNGDYQQLADEMTRLAEDRALRDRLSQNTFSRARLFDPVQIGAAFVALYRDLIKCGAYSSAGCPVSQGTVETTVV